MAGRLFFFFLLSWETSGLGSEVPSPTTNCTQYMLVSEKDKLTCECRAPQTEVKWTKLSWGKHSDAPFLEIPEVHKGYNGTIFTCQMHLQNGQVTTAVVMLQVAYGPESVKVSGPSSFVTNGKQRMTLTCDASDVNPAPEFFWSGVPCDNGNSDNTCIFAPHPRDDETTVTCTVQNTRVWKQLKADFTLNLTYPPFTPPEMSGYTPGEPLKPGDSLRCTVQGGKPPVSAVVFSCSNDTVPDETDIINGSSVSSPLNINVSGIDKEHVCTCAAVWDPQPELYSLSAVNTIILQSSSGPDSDPLSGGSGTAVTVPTAATVSVTVIIIIIIIILVIIFVRRKRGKGGRKILEDKTQTSRDQLLQDDPFHTGEEIECPSENGDNSVDSGFDPGYSSVNELKAQLAAASDNIEQRLSASIADSDCVIVDETAQGQISANPKQVTVIQDGMNGYSEVKIAEPEPTADGASHPTSMDEEEDVVQSQPPVQPGAIIRFSHADNRQWEPDIRRVKGPKGDHYTQVNRLPSRGGSG